MNAAIRRIDWLLGATVGLCWATLVLLGIGLGALVLAVPSALLTRGSIMAAIVKKYPGFPPAEFVSVVAILIGAAVIVGLAFLFIKTLLDIVTSVGTGDPLTTENAARLEKMGWLGIGAQSAGLLTAMVAWRVRSFVPKLDLDFGVDLSGVILILLLFVLARVFRAGAAMRAELEGTV